MQQKISTEQNHEEQTITTAQYRKQTSHRTDYRMKTQPLQYVGESLTTWQLIQYWG